MSDEAKNGVIDDRESGLIFALLGKLEVALAGLSGAVIAAIMLIVVCDVVMRYLFNAPLGWSYELIGAYLVVAAFFLALSDTLNGHHHVAIDIFQPLIPHRLKHLLLGVGYAAATVVLTLIAWQAWIRVASAWSADDRLSASLPWPTWPSYLFVVVGTVVILLRALVRVVGHLASAATGRELVATPPPPETSSAMEGGE